MEGKKAPQEGETLSEGLQKPQENPVTIELEREDEEKTKNEQEQGEEMRPEGLQKTQENLVMEEQPASEVEDHEKMMLRKVLRIVRVWHTKRQQICTQYFQNTNGNLIFMIRAKKRSRR